MEAGTVLVVSGRLPSLVAMRSLSRSGYRVIAGDGGEYSLARHSRRCDELWPHPPIRDRRGFLGALIRFLEQRPDVVAVLPLQDAYVSLLTESRDRLPNGVVVAAPNTEAAQACLDKSRMYAIAAELGIPHHPVERAEDLEGLRSAANAVGFPCIIRPVAWTGPLPGLRKAVVCEDRAAIDRVFASWPERLSALLVQRYVPAPRHNLYFAAREGRIVERIQIAILRTDRRDGTGLAVAGVIVAPDGRLVAHCDALVERLGYTGVGNAQFLMPSADEPRFLEINPRFGGGAHAVARFCGVDLPIATLALASGDATVWTHRPPGDPIGRRYAWTSRDLYGSAQAFAQREIGARGAIRWIAGALVAAVRARAHLTWAWDDPLPTLAVYRDLLSLRPWRRTPRP